jgi:pimeloyl-ACP methyl ester carboxylesterase
MNAFPGNFCRRQRKFLAETGMAIAGFAVNFNGCSGLTTETINIFHAKKQLMEADMAAEKFFDTGKVKINYFETGQLSGTPIVMFHGGAWCWQEYVSLIPGLSESHHIYALDLRGNGKSGWVSDQYRLENFTDDGVAFINQFKIPAVLIGHSIGGVVALMVAARCSSKVKLIIIEDSPLAIGNYNNIIELSRDMFGTWLKLKKSAQSRDELSLALAGEFGNYPGVTSQWLMFFAECLLLIDPTFFNQLLYDFEDFTRGYEYKEILNQIKCPIMFIRGETKLGAIMTDDEINWLRGNFKNIICVEISGVGHLLHMQEEGALPIKKEIMNFLKINNA